MLYISGEHAKAGTKLDIKVYYNIDWFLNRMFSDISLLTMTQKNKVCTKCIGHILIPTHLYMYC